MNHVHKVENLKKVMEELQESEAKSLLFHVFLRFNLVKETDFTETDFIKDVGNIYEMMFQLAKERTEVKEENSFQKVHILFGPSEAGSLKMALKTMKKDPLEKVISFWDIFSIGPMKQLHDNDGKEARFQWMKKVMKNEYDDFRDYQQQFYHTVHQINSIPENVPITIWVAENAHEQIGLRYVLYLLRNKTNEIEVINTTKAYAKACKRSDITYTVLYTGEIPPEKLQVIYEQSQITSLLQHERKQLEEEWKGLSNTKEMLRIWENGKLKHVKEDYYDQFMINMAKKLQHERNAEEFIKSARLIGEVIGHLNQYLGDTFFEYRLRKLIEKGVFQMKGNGRAMRFYSVRLEKN